MNYFLKLNGLSILYALAFFIHVELLLNVYRISRVTGLEISSVSNWGTIIFFLELIVGSFIFYKMNVHFLPKSKLNYLAILLWIPYSLLLLLGFATVFPITDAGDKPNPVTGLILFAEMVIYPLILWFIIGMANSREEN